jgi:hypothetical protein
MPKQASTKMIHAIKTNTLATVNGGINPSC